MAVVVADHESLAVNYGSNTVTRQGGYYVAITPDGHTGYVLVAGKYPGMSTIVPFLTARHMVLAPIGVGRSPVAIAFAP